MVKLMFICVLKKDTAKNKVTILSSAADPSMSAFFQLNSPEVLKHISKTVVEHIGSATQRATIKEQQYLCHAYVRDNRYAVTIISDEKYPTVIAHRLASIIQDEYPNVDLGSYLQRFQDPESAETLLANDKHDLDEKHIMHSTIANLMKQSESSSKSIDVGSVFTMDVSLDDDIVDGEQGVPIGPLDEIYNRTRDQAIRGSRYARHGNSQTSSRSYSERRDLNVGVNENHRSSFESENYNSISGLLQKPSVGSLDRVTDDDDIITRDIMIEDDEGDEDGLGDDCDNDDDVDEDEDDDEATQGFLGRRTGQIRPSLDQRADPMMVNYENPMPSFASIHDEPGATTHHAHPRLMTINSAAYQSRNNRYNMHHADNIMAHKLSASLPIQVPVCKPRVMRPEPENYLDDVNEDYIFDSSDCMSTTMDPRNIPKSIEALARSVRDSTHVFGDLPQRRRINTGDLVRSLRPM